jgi:hypothetical protein
MNFVRVSWDRGPCYWVGLDLVSAEVPLIVSGYPRRFWFAAIEDEL